MCEIVQNEFCMKDSRDVSFHMSYICVICFAKTQNFVEGHDVKKTHCNQIVWRTVHFLVWEDLLFIDRCSMEKQSYQIHVLVNVCEGQEHTDKIGKTSFLDQIDSTWRTVMQHLPAWNITISLLLLIIKTPKLKT